MAWVDLAANQAVTFTDIQTSGLALNIGQSAVTSVQCMRKTDAVTMYNIQGSYAPLAAKSGNQLVVKSDLIASPNTIIQVSSLYGVSITGILGSDNWPSASGGFYPVNSGVTKNYNTNIVINAQTLTITTLNNAVTTAKLVFYLDNIQQSCTAVSVAGSYNLTIPSCPIGSTILIAVDSGVC